MTFSFCWLISWIFRLLSHKYPFRNWRNSFNISKWSFPMYRKKSPRIKTHLYLFNCKCNVGSIHRSNSKNPCYQSSHFVTWITKVSTETQSIGIHDVLVFNTELAMHYRAIFNSGCFGCFVSKERLCSRVLVYISCNKSKTWPEWQLFSV